jgi:hypothetical protein
MNSDILYGIIIDYTLYKYDIYLHCRKIYNLFVRALETVRNTITN